MPRFRCLSDVRLRYGDPEIVQLCDDNGAFIRVYVLEDGANTNTVFDFDIDGNAYVTVGAVAPCLVEIDDIPPISVTESQFVPNPDGNDQSYSVGGSVETFTGLGGTLDANTTDVLIRFEVSSLRVTFNGNTPTSGINPPGLGIEYRAKDSGIWARDTLLDAQFIETISGVTGYIQVAEFMRV